MDTSILLCLCHTIGLNMRFHVFVPQSHFVREPPQCPSSCPSACPLLPLAGRADILRPSEILPAGTPYSGKKWEAATCLFLVI